MGIKLGQMRQEGYVVKDIEQAMKQWIDMGIGLGITLKKYWWRISGIKTSPLICRYPLPCPIRGIYRWNSSSSGTMPRPCTTIFSILLERACTISHIGQKQNNLTNKASYSLPTDTLSGILET